MRAMFRKAADPRVCVLLTCLAGIVVWRAGFPGVFVHCAGALLPFFLPALRRRAEPGALRAIVRFALFWAVLKLLVDSLSMILGQWPDCAPGLNVALLAEAVLLFVRMFALLTAALALTLALSPARLAGAAAWLLRPLLGTRAWKSALAFALMAQYLPRIQRLAARIRLGARSRGLKAGGIAFWRIAFPHLFQMLAQSAWKQAVAIAGRGLDRPGAWEDQPPLSAAALAALGVGAALLVWPVI